jgi:hypothetical protein
MISQPCSRGSVNKDLPNQVRDASNTCHVDPGNIDTRFELKVCSVAVLCCCTLTFLREEVIWLLTSLVHSKVCRYISNDWSHSTKFRPCRCNMLCAKNASHFSQTYAKSRHFPASCAAPQLMSQASVATSMFALAHFDVVASTSRFATTSRINTRLGLTRLLLRDRKKQPSCFRASAIVLSVEGI